MAKLVFWSTLSFKNWSFVNCSAFGYSHLVSFSWEKKSERLEKRLKTQNPCLRPGIRLRSILHLGCNWSGQLSPYGSPRPPETNDVCMNTKTAYNFMCYDSKPSLKIGPSRSHLLVVKRTFLAMWLRSCLNEQKFLWGFTKLLIKKISEIFSCLSSQTKKFCF